MRTDNGADVATEVEVFIGANTRQRPSQAENHDGRDHGVEALAEASTEFLEGDDLAGQIEEGDEGQGDGRAEDQRRRRIAIGKGQGDGLTFVDAARIEHAIDAGDDEDDDRQEQVDDLAVAEAVGIGFIFLDVLVFIGDDELLRIFPDGFAHGSIIAAAPDDVDEEEDGQPGVQIERNGL